MPANMGALFCYSRPSKTYLLLQHTIKIIYCLFFALSLKNRVMGYFKFRENTVICSIFCVCFFFLVIKVKACISCFCLGIATNPCPHLTPMLGSAKIIPNYCQFASFGKNFFPNFALGIYFLRIL